MKRLLLTLTLVSLIGSSQAASFPDVPPTDPAYNAVEFFASKGVVEGYEQTNGSRLFKPAQAVNRAEAIKMLLAGSTKLYNIPDRAEAKPFPDVERDIWFAPYVSVAKTFGIISGDGDTGNFSGVRQVNRAELMKMVLKVNGVDYEEKISGTSTTVAPDVSTSAWFHPFMRYAKAYAVITPDNQGNLYPEKALTRAEVLLIMYRVYANTTGGDAQETLSRIEAEIFDALASSNRGNYTEARATIRAALDRADKLKEENPDLRLVQETYDVTESYVHLVEASVLLREGENLEQARTELEEAKEALANVTLLSTLKRTVEALVGTMEKELE